MSMLDWFQTIGAVVAFGTGSFTLYDRLMRHRPVMSMTALREGAEAYAYLRVQNLAPYDILVEKVLAEPPILAISSSDGGQAIYDATTGLGGTALLAPGKEILFVVVRLDARYRGISEDARIKVKAEWRRAETVWVKPMDATLYTSFKDIDDRKRAAMAVNR